MNSKTLRKSNKKSAGRRKPTKTFKECRMWPSFKDISIVIKKIKRFSLLPISKPKLWRDKNESEPIDQAS